MKVTTDSGIAYDPGTCCGRSDFEYRTGGAKRKGVTIEAWVWLRCAHCKRGYRLLAYAKQAGDEDATGRQRKHRSNIEKKLAVPSTGARIRIDEMAKS